MSNYVIVRINDKLIPEFQINYNSASNTAKLSKVASWQGISVQNNQQLLLMLAGNLVLTTQVKIPSKNAEVIRQSIPFALEEMLVNDLEDNHFAYCKLAEQLFLVSIIDQEILKQITISLENYGLKCTKIYSEIFTVPKLDDTTTICAIGENFIINSATGGTTVTKNLLESYLTQLNSPNTVIYSNKNQDVSNYENIKIELVNTELLQAKTLTSATSVNLFQGDFAQNLDNKKRINPLKKLIGLATILMFSWLVINLYTSWQLSVNIDNIKQQQQDLLVKLIPNASTTERRDPFAAMQSRLQISHNSTATNGATGFIQALIYLGQTLIQHPNIRVQSLRQRENKLEIKLQTSNVSLLNNFQSALAKSVLSMRIKTGTRESNSTGVSSIITMEKL